MIKQSDYVELADGTTLPLSELPKRVPYLCFRGTTHLKICHLLADQMLQRWQVDDTTTRQVYVNFIAIRSPQARQYTALVELVRNAGLAVQVVGTNELGTILADFLPDGVHWKTDGTVPEGLLQRKAFSNFAVKSATHALYRWIGWATSTWKGHPQAIRAYFDIAERVYRDEVDHSLLLTYPFKTNVRRHMRFIIDNVRRGRRVRLTGLPYGLGSAVRVATASKHRDHVLIKAEIRAQRKHADELYDAGIRKLCVSDEARPAAIAFHRRFMERGGESINAVHGIGVYGPYIAFQEARFLNHQQKSYYQPYGTWATARIMNAADPIDVEATYQPGAPPTIVFFQGNWKNAGKFYEWQVEQRAISEVASIRKELKLDFVIKTHPSLGSDQLRELRALDGVRVTTAPCRDLANPIFVNTLSSAYFDYRSNGPCLFLEDNLLRPRGAFWTADFRHTRREPEGKHCRTHGSGGLEERATASMFGWGTRLPGLKGQRRSCTGSLNGRVGLFFSRATKIVSAAGNTNWGGWGGLRPFDDAQLSHGFQTDRIRKILSGQSSQDRLRCP